MKDNLRHRPHRWKVSIWVQVSSTQAVLHGHCFIFSTVKDAKSVLLPDQTFSHFSFITYSKPQLNSESYSLKYDKLTDIITHSYLNITEKNDIVKTRGGQILFCSCSRTMLKQLKSFITIDTFGFPCGREVTHQTPVPRSRARFPALQFLLQ